MIMELNHNYKYFNLLIFFTISVSHSTTNSFPAWFSATFEKPLTVSGTKDLLFKLKQNGINGTLLKWLANYLTNRQQRVVIQSAISNTKNDYSRSSSRLCARTASISFLCQWHLWFPIEFNQTFCWWQFSVLFSL